MMSMDVVAVATHVQQQGNGNVPIVELQLTGELTISLSGFIDTLCAANEDLRWAS
jgi:hypothetical protein